MKSRKVRRIFARRVKKYDALIVQIVARKAAKEHKKELPPRRDPCKGMAVVPLTLKDIFVQPFLADEIYNEWLKEHGHNMCHIQGEKFRHRKMNVFSHA